MYTGLYAAVSGSLAQEKRLAIQTNNLANANTVGFKADQPVFAVEPLPIVAEAKSASLSTPLRLTLLNPLQGRDSVQTSLSTVVTDFDQGDIRQTGNPLDLALEGRGFLVVQTPAGVAYTRQGTLSLNAGGTLVTQSGLPVLGTNGPIQISGGTPQISPNGQVVVNGAPVGQLQVVDFPQPYALAKQGDVLFRPLDPTLQPVAANAVVRQGSLETANAQPVRLLLSVMESSRAYEAYQRVIQAFNDIAGRAVNDIAGRA
ncbi:MAG: flagellar basal-body rod protein FlgF [Candidatus Tectimicrobiota bacterium]